MIKATFYGVSIQFSLINVNYKLHMLIVKHKSIKRLPINLQFMHVDAVHESNFDLERIR